MRKSNLITFIVLGAVMLFCHSASAWQIISRQATNGGLFGYYSVKWAIVSHTDEAGRTIKGADLTCKDPGFERCPRKEVLPAPPDEPVDMVDVMKGDELMDYAFSKIESGDLTGSHTITVYNVDDNTYRIYKVEWTSTDSTASTSSIIVTRD